MDFLSEICINVYFLSIMSGVGKRETLKLKNIRDSLTLLNVLLWNPEEVKYRSEKFEISYRFRETYVMSWRKFFRGSHETAMALDVLKITRSRQTMFLEFTITRGYLFAVCYPKPYARTFTRFFICRGELYLGSTSFYR